MSDYEPPLKSPRGEVITFYSYKGGTGRTMALANTACLLSGEGPTDWQYKVLMIDWDLEAPGLHRYFRERFRGMLGEGAYLDEELDAKPGLMDLMTTLRDQVYAGTPLGSMQDQDTADELLANCDIHPFILHTDNPQLDLMKAGKQDASYGDRVSLFDWQGFFKRSPWLFRAFVDRLAREYDYVLVDSRTGETDTSGICTRMLPQKLVVVFTPNRQSLTGVDALVRQAIAYRRKSEDPRPLAVFPLPSRVDSTFPTLVQNWRDGNQELELDGYRWHFEKLLRSLYGLDDFSLEEYFKEVELQYIPEYSFGEEVAVRREKSGSRLSFAKSYETFTRWLVERAGPWEHSGVVQERESRAAERRARRKPADEVLSALSYEEQRLVRALFTRLVRLSRDADRLFAERANFDELSSTEQAAVNRLQGSGLVVLEGAEGSGKSTVRFADDSLLEWSRLKDWCKEDRAFLLWRQDLNEARTRWEARGKPDDLLWTGPQLQRAPEFTRRRPDELNTLETAFLTASLARQAAAEIPTSPETRKARALELFRGVEADISEIERLANALKRDQAFGYARRLFARARRHEGFKNLSAERRLRIGQGLALCTYKDADLPFDDRFPRALDILQEVDDPAVSTSQETLGLTGSIYKRMWQADGQLPLLERSLQFYRRGHGLGVTKDLGYNGGNAAFVLDLLSREDAVGASKAGTESSLAATRRDEARRIREELVRKLPPLLDGPEGDNLRGQWWFCATVAEAYFGLAKYDEGVQWLRQGPPISMLPPWELESTIQQLGTLLQLQADFLLLMPGYSGLDSPLAPDRARAVLREFLGSFAAGVERVVSGKLGLALSGGGFRASLFHIGVLACLAERDALRHVEVLSCVSGGSIIGAHYYLEVQNLLEKKMDEEITQQDYVDIVSRVADDFLRGVQTNIRSQVLAEFWTNLKAMFWPSYTRTQRVGELYESRLFSRVPDNKGDAKRFMDDLIINPRGESAGAFKPKYDNWRRRNKVPILVLNATTLNTGHNWQFTASWMGEPPAGIDAEIDGNYRLRRMYYPDAPPKFQRVRLGNAVAASACVPGLFEPIVLKGLYPDKTIRLVDGGVYDNQGVASLLEQDCSVMLVSDASGQMSAVDEPSAGMIGVPLRSFNVSMARVRQAEYHELDARRRSSALRGLMFVHLKKDLDVAAVDWVDCQDPSDATDDATSPDRKGILTRFGIRKDVQARLAAIRTDLDSFTEIEAYALMTSGYRMAQTEFRRSLQEFPQAPERTPQWKFLQVEPLLSQGHHFAAIMKQLRVASQPALKVWRLSRPLTVVGIILLVALAAALVSAVFYWRSLPVLTVGGAGESVLVLLATLVVGPTLVRLVRFRKTLGQVGLVTAASLAAAIIFRLHLWFFNPLFLSLGRLDKFTRGTSAKPKQTSTTAKSA